MGWGAFSHARATPSFCLRAAGAAGVLEALAAEPRSNAPPSMNPALTTRRACAAAWRGTDQRRIDSILVELKKAEPLSGGNAHEA